MIQSFSQHCWFYSFHWKGLIEDLLCALNNNCIRDTDSVVSVAASVPCSRGTYTLLWAWKQSEKHRIGGCESLMTGSWKQMTRARLVCWGEINSEQKEQGLAEERVGTLGTACAKWGRRTLNSLMPAFVGAPYANVLLFGCFRFFCSWPHQILGALSVLQIPEPVIEVIFNPGSLGL